MPFFTFSLFQDNCNNKVTTNELELCCLFPPLPTSFPPSLPLSLPTSVVTVNVGLAVGLAIGGFVLFIVVPIIVCVVICCCLGVCAGVVAGSGGRRTRVVTHTAPSAAPHTTVVTSNTSNMMQVYIMVVNSNT